MKKHILKLLICMLTLSVLGFGATHIEAREGHGEMPQFNDVDLSDNQVEELRTMYEDVLNKRIGIINKYIEYGVLSKEDGEKMKEQLNMFFKKLEKDKFIPKWDKHHKKGE